MNVITISRQVGSWGDYIGVDVAKTLNMRYIDREIISTAAARAGISETTLERLQEPPKGLISRVMDSLSNMSLAPTTPSQALRQSDYYSLVSSGGVTHAQVRSLMLSGFSQAEAVRHEVAKKFPEARALDLIRSVVTEFARNGNVVLSGSGSRMFLKDWPDVLRALIVAPSEDRIKAIMEQEGVSQKIAEMRVKENDEARSVYIRKHDKADWLDPSLYDVVINTGRIPRNLAVELIAKTAKSLS